MHPHIGKRVRWKNGDETGTGTLLAVDCNKTYLVKRDDGQGWQMDESDLNTPSWQKAYKQEVEVGETNLYWVDSYELMENTNEWEKGKIITNGTYFSKILGVLDDLVFMGNYHDSLEEARSCTAGSNFYTTDRLNSSDYKLVDEQETIEVDVVERVKELKPLE